jgi:trk system potassium uptake protein TrkH
MAVLIVTGGLGFVVLYNIFRLRVWKRDRIERGRLTLQSKIVLVGSAAFLLGGLVLFVVFEWGNTMEGMPFGKRALNGFFCAVTPRTAGFNTVDYSAVSKPSMLLTMFLMFIGASPGSTGGGIKTCTFIVLIMTSWAMIRGSQNVTIFRRTIPTRIVQEAIGILSISILIIVVMTITVTVTEMNTDFGSGPDAPGSLARIVFEVVSAFGTVGLSTGITPALSMLGKIFITITMFIGRIGPLVISLAIAQREIPPAVAYPEEKVMVG